METDHFKPIQKTFRVGSDWKFALNEPEFGFIQIEGQDWVELIFNTFASENTVPDQIFGLEFNPNKSLWTNLKNIKIII